MIIVFTISAWEDYSYWQTNYPSTAKKITSLIKEILRTPFSGSGRPEALKHELSGCWSRRIDREHRLVYKFEQHKLSIISCRFHYH